MKFVVAFVALAVSLCAQPKFEYWPGASYDPAIPVEKQVIGHDPGARVSSHAEIMHYLEALSAAAPTRMKIFEYAKTCGSLIQIPRPHIWNAPSPTRASA